MKKWKTLILNLLGLVTTAATIAIIYFVLYLQGTIKHIGQSTVIEFIVMIILSTSTKFFWYMSTESSIRNSDKYIEKRDLALGAINESITDQQDFDKFIDVQNLVNYNTFVSNRCKGLTPKNYKLTFANKLTNIKRRLAHQRPLTPREFLNAYIMRVERKANAIHKLSASNIVNLNDSEDGLIDDRNDANKSKRNYLISSTVMSIVTMFANAMIGFMPNSDVDKSAALVKMVMYSVTILMSILQAIFKAYVSVQINDTAYFRKIINILEKYVSYKESPVSIEKVNYYFEEEAKNAINKYSDSTEYTKSNNDSRYNTTIDDAESIRHNQISPEQLSIF